MSDPAYTTFALMFAALGLINLRNAIRLRHYTDHDIVRERRIYVVLGILDLCFAAIDAAQSVIVI